MKDENVQRLQMIEQNLQMLNKQKQQFQAQAFEVDGAITELEHTSSAYKIIGGLMIQTNKETLRGELKSKKELLDLRVKTLEKQEQQIRDKAQQLREEVLKSKE